MSNECVPGKIAVDLVPILAGGVNGGIKPLTLHLLDGLATRGWSITAFCRPSALDELAAFFGDRIVLKAVNEGQSLEASYHDCSARTGGFDLNFFPMQRVSIDGANHAVVSSVMDVQFADLSGNFSSTEVAEREASFRTCVEKSDRIVAISRFTKSRIVALSDFPSERIDVIPISPPQMSVSEGAASDALARHSLEADGYIVYPANFWVHKRHVELVDGYAQYAASAVSPVKLVLTGDATSDLGREIAKRAVDIGNIVVTGFLPGADLASLMAHSRAIIFPSSYEGFGMPIIEAMALGRPVAAAWNTSIPEVAGGAALLFDSSQPASIAAALRRIANDDALRARLVARAERRLIGLGRHADMVTAYEQTFFAAIADARKSQAIVHGLYPDRWSTPELNLEAPPTNSGSRLEVDLAVPQSSPCAAVTVAVEVDGEPMKSAVLWRGGNFRITHSFGQAGGRLTIGSFPRFRPRDWFASDDTRELALRVGPIRLHQDGISSDAITGRNLSVSTAAPRDAVIAIACQGMDGTTQVLATSVPTDAGTVLQLFCAIDGGSIAFATRPLRFDEGDADVLEARLECEPGEARMKAATPEAFLLKFASTEIVAPAVIAPRSAPVPGFSVVVPSFEQGRFIGRTIDSILAQQGLCDIGVFDGGSQDETLDVLACYGSAIHFESGPDGGQANAVNKGISASRGEIIAWINSDDTYEPEAFAHVAELFARNPDIGVIYGEAYHIDECDAVIERYPVEDFDLDRLFQNCFICQPAAFVRRSVLERHGALRDSLHYCLDYELWLRLGSAGVPFLRTGEFLANSRFYDQTKTVASRPQAYFETADMMIRCFSRHQSEWPTHVVNAVRDYMHEHAASSPVAAARQARLLLTKLWDVPPGS